MIDFNKEFDILQRWIDYRVDWYAVYLTQGRMFYIDIDALPTTATPKQIMKWYQETGIVYYRTASSIEINEHKCLTFEQFKETLCYTTK